MSHAIITAKPGALALDSAAAYLAMSTATFQRQVQQGALPQPVLLSTKRVGWLTAELDAWLLSRPRADLLPPPGSGYGRNGKPSAAA